jgi:predicted membrane protein
MDPTPSPPRNLLTGRLLVGLLFIAGGLLFTAANLGFVQVREVWRFWPLVLVAIGLLRLSCRNYFAGVIFIGLGGLFLAREFDLIWFRLSMLFPLVFVLVGLNIVAEHWRKRPGASPGDGAPGGTLSEWAVFGGGKRRVQSREFRGGQANAMFGGFEIDLREAQMAGDSATIDVFCFCGGGEIRVPESWNVTMKAIAIFGGQDDKTRPPAPGSAHKELFVTGFILFGGLGVKN